MLLIVGFYSVGGLIFIYVENWTFFQGIYFISSTVSTVGYGDLHPETAVGRMYCILMIFVGVTLVWSTIRKYIDSVHEVVHEYHQRLLKVFGLRSVDVDRLPIYKYTPDEVEAMINYPIKYAEALGPLFFLLTFAFAIGKATMGLTVIQSLYFTVVTCTTVGYGEFSPTTGGTRAFFSVFLLVLCIVVTKTGSDLYHIIVKRKIRTGDAMPDLEEMLLHKVRTAPRSKAGYSITESEFIVEALLREKLVDRMVLLAVRRTYHWVARGGDGCRSDITVMDLYEQHRTKKLFRTPHRKITQSLARRALSRTRALARRAVFLIAPKKWTHTSSSSSSEGDYGTDEFDDDVSDVTTDGSKDDETFEEWRQRYWEPKMELAREQGMRALALDRMMTDPFAVESVARFTVDSVARRLTQQHERPTLDSDDSSAFIVRDMRHLLTPSPRGDREARPKRPSFFFADALTGDPVTYINRHAPPKPPVDAFLAPEGRTTRAHHRAAKKPPPRGNTPPASSLAPPRSESSR